MVSHQRNQQLLLAAQRLGRWECWQSRKQLLVPVACDRRILATMVCRRNIRPHGYFGRPLCCRLPNWSSLRLVMRYRRLYRQDWPPRQNYQYHEYCQCGNRKPYPPWVRCRYRLDMRQHTLLQSRSWLSTAIRREGSIKITIKIVSRFRRFRLLFVIHRLLPSKTEANLSRRSCRARISRVLTEPSGIFMALAISVLVISSTVERIRGSRKSSGKDRKST